MDETATIGLTTGQLVEALTTLSYPAVMQILEDVVDFHSDSVFEDMFYTLAWDVKFK